MAKYEVFGHANVICSMTVYLEVVGGVMNVLGRFN